MTVKINGRYTEHAPALYIEGERTPYAELTWNVGARGLYRGDIEFHVDGKPLARRITSIDTGREHETGFLSVIEVWCAL